MYALTVLTPIVPGHEQALRDYLEALGRTPSPLARLPRTHFGRWVIVPAFVTDPEQPTAEELECAYLLFTATFDGPLDSYLDELCGELAPEAERIWGSCIGCPGLSGDQLKAYLLGNQVHTGLFFSAYPDATVEVVRKSLHVRDKAIAFAVGAQEMEPAELQRAFLEEFEA
jgi:hypothetical protein